MKFIYFIIFFVALLFIFILLGWLEVTSEGNQVINLVKDFIFGLLGLIFDTIKGLFEKLTKVL